MNKTYRQGNALVHAVRDVSLEIVPGERLYVHGPSGAGKSTLLNMLGALSRPTSGEVFFRERSVYGMSDRARSGLRNALFGFVFQFYYLLPELSVAENVMLPAMIAGKKSGARIRQRAHELLRRVGLGHRLAHPPSKLSGGEAQRAAIARALINSPAALFCDEPAGNLDSEMSGIIWRLLREISEENGMSVVVVSHAEPAERFFHRKFYMKDGILIEEKPFKFEIRNPKYETPASGGIPLWRENPKSQ